MPKKKAPEVDKPCPNTLPLTPEIDPNKPVGGTVETTPEATAEDAPDNASAQEPTEGQETSEGIEDTYDPRDARIEALQAEMDALKAEKEADLANVKANKDQILAEKRALADAKRDLESQLADVSRLLQEREGNLATVIKAGEDAVTKAEADASEKLSAMQAQIDAVLIENALMTGLSDYALMPHASGMAKRLLSEKAAIVDGAVTLDGKPVSDALKEWSQTEGRMFIRSLSAGGGASANLGRPVKPKVANPWVKGPDFNLTEQGRISLADPKLAAQLKRQAGVR